jgi:hypothetical protein
MSSNRSQKNKSNSNHNKTMSQRGGAKKLPTSEHASIKRAKKAIQKLLLNTNESKTAALTETAKEEIANAKKNAGDRKYWHEEVLIASNKQFSDTVGSSSWYTKVRTTQWSLTKMPAWAHNGKDEPDAGTMIEGKAYTKAPPSQPR